MTPIRTMTLTTAFCVSRLGGVKPAWWLTVLRSLLRRAVKSSANLFSRGLDRFPIRSLILVVRPQSGRNFCNFWISPKWLDRRVGRDRDFWINRETSSATRGTCPMVRPPYQTVPAWRAACCFEMIRCGSELLVLIKVHGSLINIV